MGDDAFVQLEVRVQDVDCMRACLGPFLACHSTGSQSLQLIDPDVLVVASGKSGKCSEALWIRWTSGSIRSLYTASSYA